MKAVIQRVSYASVKVDAIIQGQIQNGLLVFLGIDYSDTIEDADWLCKKIIGLRIFSDKVGLMNLSLLDNFANVLLISQFTLIASCKKGNRPSFINAARPEQAILLYQYCIQSLESKLQKKIAKGVFGADMQIELINDGPVTIILDTKNKE